MIAYQRQGMCGSPPPWPLTAATATDLRREKCPKRKQHLTSARNKSALDSRDTALQGLRVHAQAQPLTTSLPTQVGHDMSHCLRGQRTGNTL